MAHSERRLSLSCHNAAGLGDENFQEFTAKVIESFKSKEPGALRLSKGMSVRVNGLSADGEKYFGEFGKNSGWFPKDVVLREKPGMPKSKVRSAGRGKTAPISVDDSHLSASAPMGRNRRAQTGGPMPVFEPERDVLSRSVDSPGRNPPSLAQHLTNSPVMSGPKGLSASLIVGPSHPVMLTFDPSTESTATDSDSDESESARSSENDSGNFSTPTGSPIATFDTDSPSKQAELRRHRFMTEGGHGRLFASVGSVARDGADFFDMTRVWRNRQKPVGTADPAAARQERREAKEKEKLDKKEAKKTKKHKKQMSKSKPCNFGVPFEEIMERQHHINPDLQLPALMTSLAHAVVALGGVEKEGIFRVSASLQQLDDQRISLDCDKATKMEDPHAASSLFKLMLSSQPEPLIPTELHQQCLNTIDNWEDSVKLIDELPELRRRILHFLLQYLQEYIMPHQEVTKMNTENLAMVFSPCIIYDSNDTNVAELVKKTEQAKQFLINLLQNCKYKTPLDFENDKKTGDIVVIGNNSNSSSTGGSNEKISGIRANMRLSLSLNSSAPSKNPKIGMLTKRPSGILSPRRKEDRIRDETEPSTPTASPLKPENALPPSRLTDSGSQIGSQTPPRTRSASRTEDGPRRNSKNNVLSSSPPVSPSRSPRVDSPLSTSKENAKLNGEEDDEIFAFG